MRQRRVKFKGNKKKNFTEGWVEFHDKRVAKTVALMLNNTPIGGKKCSYYHDDLWNIKYLSKFRWTHLTEKIGKRLIDVCTCRLYQERIMRKEGRGVECDTTTHLIKIQIFTHASHVTKFSLV